MRPIQRDSEALTLLIRYAAMLINEDALATSSLQQVVVNHVHDLIALALGATRNAAPEEKHGGLRAARLAAAKTFVAQNSARRDLSVGTVATHLGLTPRHLQRLFEAVG